MMSASDFFKRQIELVKKVATKNCIVMGDFNLDARMNHNQDYNQKALLEILNSATSAKNLMQIIEFTTWSRTIKGTLKESLLDHVYVCNFALVENIDFEVPAFGDHVLIKIKMNMNNSCYQNTVITKRSWSNYSVDSICNEFANMKLNEITIQCLDANIQEHWNVLEDVILQVIEYCPRVSLYLHELANCAKSFMIPVWLNI